MKGFLIIGRKKFSKVLIYMIIFGMLMTLFPVAEVRAETGPLPVYAEDFSDGTADGWTTYSGSDPGRQWDWSVNPQNQYTVSGNTGAKAIAGGTDFQDLVYEADIQVEGFNDDNSGLLFRVSEPSGNAGNGFNGYYAGIRVDKKLELGRVTGSNTWKSLVVTDLPASCGHMKIKAVGNEIQVYFNDMSSPKIQYTDNDGSQITSPGAIGVRTYWGTSNIDNIRAREYSHIETQAPGFSIPEGAYNDPQTVEISAAGGAVIHYTTDGSMPDSNSPVYSSPIQLERSATVKAYAEKSGEMVSEIAAATYIIGSMTQGFSDDFEDGSADGWTTYRGLDNNEGIWSVSAGKYILNKPKGDKALADGTSYNNFIFDADVNPGTGNDSSGLIFRCSEPGDGCDNLNGYFAGINVNGYVQIGKMDSNANNGNGGWKELYRAVANVRANQDNHMRVYANGSHFYVFVNGEPAADFIDTDYPDGSVGVRGWNVNGNVTFDNMRITGMDMLLGTVEAPFFTPASGAFETSQQVEISCNTPDADVYYTIDGSMPTTASTVYSGAITLNDTATVKAIAAKAGMLDSQVQSATYTKLSASFSEDFSSGNYNKWTPYGGTWSVSGNTLQVASGQGYKVMAKNTEFSNVSYEADLKITGGTGDAGILFRVTGASVGGDNVIGYYAGINAGGDAVILGKMNNNWNELTRVPKTIDINKTYHLKVVAYGTLIKVFLDDMATPVISFNDNTYTRGAIGLRIYNASVAFGNIHAETYAAPVLIESFKTAQVTTRAKVAPIMPEQVTALHNNGLEQSVNVTWDTITADKYENPGSFTVEGTVDGTALKAAAKVTVAAAPLAPGEALPVANQGPLVKTPFIPLPLGSVKADGWLLQQLLLQKSGATGHAEEIYSELGSNSAWLGGNAPDSDWERPVYYVKGLVALAYTLGDTELQDKAAKWIEWALQSQKPDGSFGPSTSADWWPRMPMLYAMRDYCEATGDQRVITFMTNYFHYQAANLTARPLTDWSKARVGDNIDTVLWLYNRTREESLLDLADTLKNQGYDHTSIFSNDNFFGFGSDFHPNHNVNVSEDIKMPAIYYQRSGSEADKDAFRLGDSHLLKYHGQITGMSSGTEFLAGPGSTQGAELCAIVERMQSNEEAQMILGDPYLGDQLEKIAFNALPGAISKDFKLQQYYSLPNQVQSVNGPHGHRQDYGNGLQPSPDSGFPCCRFDMHMGWPYYVKNMWAATDDGGIAAMAYGPSNVTTKINNIPVTITETTNYPFEEQLRFTVNTSADNQFPLKLRIPEWCGQPVVEVNGTVQTGVASGEYYTIDRTWTDGDVVTLSLPMEVKTSTQVSNSIGVERGPLVYSLKIGENWKKVSERVAGYVEYEVLPTTDWNYGLITDSSDPAASFTVNKSQMPENPFIQGTTPVTLTARAKKVTSWKLGPNGMDADEVPLGPVISAMPEENVTLVPFGAENIRVTYFPRIADSTTPMSKKYEAEDAVLSGGVKVNNGGTGYSTTVSNGRYAGNIDNADSSVLFNNVYARETGTYTLEIAYASGWAGYSTHKLTVNGQAAGSVKYSPIDGWGKFSRIYVPVNLNKGNNTIQLTKGENFAELDYIAVLNAEDTFAAPVQKITVSGLGGAAAITARGGTLQMTADILPVDATNKAVSWSVENDTGRAAIDQTGLLKAAANGTVTVRATARDGAGASGTLQIVISGQPVYIPDFSEDFADQNTDNWTAYGGSWSAASGACTVNPGDGYKAVANGTDFSNFIYEADVAISGGTASDNAGLIFRVSEPTVGADNLKGYYVGICNDGKVQIGRFNNGWKELAAAPFAVEANRTYHFRVEANGPEISVFVDDVYVAGAEDGMWSHGAIGMRTWRVNAKYDNVAVYIIRPVESITLDKDTLTLEASGTAQLTATAGPHNATDRMVHFTSDNAAVTVSDEIYNEETGMTTVTVTANNTGREAITASITAAAEDRSGIASICNVTVKPPEKIAVNKITVSGENGVNIISTKGGQLKMHAAAEPENAEDKSVTWSVQNGTGSAVINAGGVLTAVTDGTVTVKAAAAGNPAVWGTCTVTISGQSSNPGDSGSGSPGGGSGNGNNSGNSSGSSTGNSVSGGTQTQAASSQVAVKPVLGANNTALAAVSAAELEKAFNAAKADSSGIKTITLEVAKVEGAGAYTVELPKQVLATAGPAARIKLATAAGTVTVPGNMFENEDVKGSTIQITVGAADKASLTGELKQNAGSRPVIELKASSGGNELKWNNPEAPIKVAIKYTPSKEELANPEHITVWGVNGSGRAVAIPDGRYDAAAGTVSFTAERLGRYAVVYVEKTFTDIGGYTWARNAIEVMAAKGIISGTSETAYSPGKSIRRADFMLMLVKTLGLSAKVDGNFEDVKPGSYYYDAVGTAKKLGITSGVGDNRFDPSGYISRQDMMVLVERALKAAGKQVSAGSAADLASYKDTNKISGYAEDAISALVREGLIKGSGNMINPRAQLTRAEAAAVIYKLYYK